MIEIIKPGKLESKRKISATCRKCDCVFTFTAEDADLVSDRRDGDYYAIKCPMESCGNRVTRGLQAKTGDRT
jgi:hypothetical protein